MLLSSCIGAGSQSSYQMPSDEYLIQTFDPLAPARFVDSSLLDTGKAQDLESQSQDEASQALMDKPGLKVRKVGKAPQKAVTLENMFNRQIEKQIINH